MGSKTLEQVEAYLKEKKADFYDDISQPLYKREGMCNWVYDIHISWGDWKHEHGYLRYLMEEFGYVETNCIITEENGSDCYSATHRFVLKEAHELFKI